MKTLRSCATTLALLAATGCSPQFASPTLVEKLELLGLRSEPPEIAPAAMAGEPAGAWPRPPSRAALTSLVAQPANLIDPAHRLTVLYLACTPKLGDPSSLPCDSFDVLRDPGSLVQGEGLSCSGSGSLPEPGVGVQGGVSFSGLEECDASGCHAAQVGGVTLPAPLYALPADLVLSALPVGTPARTLGIHVTVVAIAVDASPEELFAGNDACQWLQSFPARLQEMLASRENVTATKRILVRGPDAEDEPNRNPSLPGVTRDGATLGDAPAEVEAGAKVPLLPMAPADTDYQTYSKYEATGVKVETKRESWAWSWFTTAGEFEDAHTLKPDEVATWDVPLGTDVDPLPESGSARIYVVVRDLRGGMSWLVREAKLPVP
ncbi:MAG: hypothetical protein HY901_28620 [Deltaproteobacteria bacterium]|nr:hypothetical protein [Deltaproteobacteria bacterium]